MRVRPMLLAWGALNFYFGYVLVLQSLKQKMVAAVVVDLAYGFGFLLATLLCALAIVLWSTWMQRHVAIWVIRRARLVALGTSLSMMLALLGIEALLALHTGNIGTVIIVAVMAWLEMLSINETSLTPARERYIWQPVQKG